MADTTITSEQVIYLAAWLATVSGCVASRQMYSATLMNKYHMPEMDFFEWSSLGPGTTGLPFVVWISIKGEYKISSDLRAEIHDINMRTPREQELFKEWTRLNHGALAIYAQGNQATDELLDGLRPVMQQDNGT